MVYFRSRAGKVADDLGVSCDGKQYHTKKKKKKMALTGAKLKELPAPQTEGTLGHKNSRNTRTATHK